MKHGPNKARPLIVNNRIAGTGITVWGVLHYLETGWSRPEIAATLHLSDAQVDAAAKFIEAHQEELMAVGRKLHASWRRSGNSVGSTAPGTRHARRPPLPREPFYGVIDSLRRTVYVNDPTHLTRVGALLDRLIAHEGLRETKTAVDDRNT